MASVSPASIRRAVRPGETVIQNFTVRPVPDGTIVATVQGGEPFVRFHAITASDEIRVRLTDEEFAQLPPALRNEAHRFSIETIETARATAGKSLPVRAGQFVAGDIEFFAPAGTAPTSVSATLVVQTSGVRTDVPILFIVGELKVEFLDDPIIALRGQAVPVTVRFALPKGSPATRLRLDSVEPFMRVLPVDVDVPAGGSVTTSVSLFTDGVTPLGPFATNLRVNGFSGLATNFPFRGIVKNPFRVSGFITPASLTAAQGSEVTCQIEVHAQGGAGPVQLTHGKLPPGVRMEPAAFSVGPDSAGTVHSAKLIVARDAPTGTSLWIPVLWRSADGQSSGSFNTLLTITLTPESRTFRHTIVTPALTALGGQAELTIRNDGTYTFRGHLHDSGLDSYDFRLNLVFRTSPDRFIALTEFASGRVAGTLGSGSRDSDWEQNPSNDLIRRQWPSFRDGAAEFTFDFDDKGVLGLLGDVSKAIAEIIVARVVAGPVVAPLIMIGSRIASAANLPLASPTGIPGAVVLGGAALLFGPLAAVPAFLAGAAIASLSDVKSRPMRDNEKQLAFTVFRDTLPIDRIRITNLSHSDGRAFTTVNTADRSILLCLGEDAFNGVNRTPETDQTFIHELTHAWQFEHSSFGVADLWDQVRKPFLTKAQEDELYDPGPFDGRPWSAYGVEQQAVIVANWFAINGLDPQGALRIGIFSYIQNNIRRGRS